nr:hypothetical protein [Tanacetum cinerariifolium]
MDIVAERVARKAAKSEVQSSLKPSPVTGDGDDSGSEEGDDSGSEEEGDEEEDEKKVDEEEDKEEG